MVNSLPLLRMSSNQRLSRCVGQDELLVIITVRSTEFARATTYGVMFVWHLAHLMHADA